MDKINLEQGTIEIGGEKEKVLETVEKEIVREPSLKPKTKSKNRLKLGIVILIIGIASLAAGVAFLAMTLNKGPSVQDAEYLVSVKDWQREDGSNVMWSFSEIGKGSLTTDGHANDYNFIWAMEGDKLKIETEWLYTINDEFEYKIEDGKLILNGSIVFTPAN